MRTLRALFLARPAREKLLVLLLLIGLVVLWGSNLLTRLEGFTTDVKSVSKHLQDQHQLIARKDKIEKLAQEEASHLDPAETLDALRLNSTVDSIARDAGLNGANIVGVPDVAPSGNFAFHTVTFTVQRASWESIENFCFRLSQKAPYLGIESFSLLADRGNPALLNASLSISSVEITHPAP